MNYNDRWVARRERYSVRGAACMPLTARLPFPLSAQVVLGDAAQHQQPAHPDVVAGGASRALVPVLETRIGL
jgi:hypothetical protein